MSDHEYDELSQENSSLREMIDILEKKENSLESDLDEVRSELRSEKEDNEELREEIGELRQVEQLSKQFNEIFEFYDTIWSDDVKDKMLITKLTELHREYR